MELWRWVVKCKGDDYKSKMRVAIYKDYDYYPTERPYVELSYVSCFDIDRKGDFCVYTSRYKVFKLDLHSLTTTDIDPRGEILILSDRFCDGLHISEDGTLVIFGVTIAGVLPMKCTILNLKTKEIIKIKDVLIFSCRWIKNNRLVVSVENSIFVIEERDLKDVRDAIDSNRATKICQNMGYIILTNSKKNEFALNFNGWSIVYDSTSLKQKYTVHGYKNDVQTEIENHGYSTLVEYVAPAINISKLIRQRQKMIRILRILR